MQNSWLGRAALCGLILFAAEATVSGQEKEVAFPKLPAGAGAIAADAPKEFTTTKSGLKYRVLRAGKGPTAGPKSKVTTNYHGWFNDGSSFDSSYGKKPFSFSVAGGVIQGWIEGVQLVGEGGMIELDVPSDLAYGKAGHPAGIAPNTPLHFVVEVLKVQ